MTLLSLDVGVTTGYAILSDPNPEAPWKSGNLLNEYALTLQEQLNDLRMAYLIDEVVVEFPLIVPGNLGKELRAVVLNVLQIFPHPVEVTPSQWKPTPWGKHPLPRGLTQHERDAIRLGLWYLNRPEIVVDNPAQVD